MSKSTNRYGAIKYVMRSFIEAHPEHPPKEVREEWNRLNKIANCLYGCDYFRLRDKMRVVLHEIDNGVAVIGNVPVYAEERMKLAKAKL